METAMNINDTNQGPDESGYVMITIMLMLAFLSLIGISSTKTADLEVQIGGNDKYYKEKQYLAEAAAMELIQYIRNEKEIDKAETLVERSSAALNRGNTTYGSRDGVRNMDNWTPDNEEETVPDANVTDADLVSEETDTSVMDRARGPMGATMRHTSEDTISRGGSLQSMTQSSDHTYAVIGSFVDGHVNIVIEAGYRTRF